jgi:hypothetical protein
MIRVLPALATLLLFTASTSAEPARIGPADTGLPANPALGAPTMAVPSTAMPRPVSPPQPSSSTLPPSTSTTSQPSEACRKFPNLC